MSDITFTFYGGAREFARYCGPETILQGPAETGKTISALWKLHLCALKYENASIIIARKTLSSTYATVLQTYRNKVLGGDPARWNIVPYGGEKPEWFDYLDTGARIWITGLDKSSKVLSSEHDIIYVNQVEELILEDWETLTTRTTGRAGNMPYSQTFGDMNPAWPSHWVYSRSTLRMFYSHHRENPVLFNQATGEITEQGKRTMAVLEALTGVRRERLLLGRSARAEGAIYSMWDDAVHLIYADVVPEGYCIAGVDWGYTNPGALGTWRVDSDGRMYLVHQVYWTRRTVDWWIAQAREAQERFDITVFVCDPSEPAYIQQFNDAGLRAVAGFNSVGPGIDKVIGRLKVQPDGRARLFIVRDSLSKVDEKLKQAKKPYMTEQEIPGYVWEGRERERPVKEDDHGMDMMRYAVCYVDGLGRGEGSKRVRVMR